jgi:hypothetical protein
MWHSKSFEKSSAQTDETSESMSETLYDDQVPLFWLPSSIVSSYFSPSFIFNVGMNEGS